jgi:hypothetical protein
MVKQITVRGVSYLLSRRLHEMSRAQGKSVNATVIEILEGAAGVDTERRIARLKRYITWTASDGAEFDQSLRAQRVIDEKLWR